LIYIKNIFQKIKIFRFNFLKITEIKNSNNILHDENKPALIHYNTNLKYIVKEEYYNNGKLHSYGDKPSVTENFQNGMPKLQVWYKNGILHREERLGPAQIEYELNGNKVSETYFNEGKIHRENGPARIISDCSNVSSKQYYLKDECIKIEYFDNDEKPYNVNYFLAKNHVSKKDFYRVKHTLRKGIRKYKNNKRKDLLTRLEKTKFKNKDLQRLLTTFVI